MRNHGRAAGAEENAGQRDPGARIGELDEGVTRRSLQPFQR